MMRQPGQEEVRLQRSITIANDVEEVPRMSQFIEEFCEETGLDMSVTMRLNLAIEEAVVNVIHYAYPPGTVGDVAIEAKAGSHFITFVVRDSGVPFDPTARGEVDTTLCVEERPIGGLGIHLVRQIMDEICYERLDGQNVLTISKRIEELKD